MLFTWGEPLPAKEAADVFGMKEEEARELFLELKEEYEECFGPLTHKSGSGFEWVKDPWPWEYKECDC